MFRSTSSCQIHFGYSTDWDIKFQFSCKIASFPSSFFSFTSLFFGHVFNNDLFCLLLSWRWFDFFFACNYAEKYNSMAAVLPSSQSSGPQVKCLQNEKWNFSFIVLWLHIAKRRLTTKLYTSRHTLHAIHMHGMRLAIHLHGTHGSCSDCQFDFHFSSIHYLLPFVSR